MKNTSNLNDILLILGLKVPDENWNIKVIRKDLELFLRGNRYSKAIAVSQFKVLSYAQRGIFKQFFSIFNVHLRSWGGVRDIQLFLLFDIQLIL